MRRKGLAPGGYPHRCGGTRSLSSSGLARTEGVPTESRKRSRRVTGVCSGAFILAAAGLLDGLRATTHWRAAALLQKEYPEVQVESDRIFVKEGLIWTSAGVTAGIDLALALIEEDLGVEPAKAAVQELVVYYRRPGGQSQLSALLRNRNGSDRSRPPGRPIVPLAWRHGTNLAADICATHRSVSRATLRKQSLSSRARCTRRPQAG